MKKLILVATLASVAGAAAAGAMAQQPAQKGSEDPDRMICRRITQTGSRLQGERVCMTAAQWAEQRRIQRSDIEHAQTTIIDHSGG
ncbi:hypothetical protein GCM10023232_04650 [Sphingosinicella ginsenosidimutans]|uniref:Secreted protein n=1 Tax=Allosphingosinicella ginsenosidimutans TaxID=1176539 RepID=A0A5C6TWN3_9SPHN|nr:hypothetical protein [Sphingosinicella ginsenosidimutans]TXC64321.1 hypothetical protein FRZ32_12080 [Sphingosinicella ginsenosidimutans]